MGYMRLLGLQEEVIRLCIQYTNLKTSHGYISGFTRDLSYSYCFIEIII
jgi:hypothetical protein